MSPLERCKQPLVSAVVITHNRIDLVDKAISSVQKQTYPNIELILVDDASIDGTPEKMTAMAEENGFQYIYIPPNDSKGGNYARNIGTLAAKGEYVAFLDDDDEWVPEKTAKQVELLREHPECEVCYCGKIYDYNFGERQKFQNTVKLKDGDLSKEILIRVLCTTSTLVIRRELLIDVGLFDESLRFWQEYELCIRLFQETRVAVVRENLVLYRISCSDKGRLTNKVRGWEDAVNYIYGKHSEEMKRLSIREIKRRDAFHYSDGAVRCYNCGDNVGKKEYLKKAFQAAHRPKDFIKMLMNVCSLSDLLMAFKH